MTKKSQCEIHAEEIKELRKIKHVNSNEISKLKLMHEENLKDIDVIKKDLFTIKENHLSHIEKDVAVLKENVKRIDKIQWAVLGFTFASLVGIVINTYLKFH